MREKLEIRCSTERVFEPFIKTYPKFKKQWLTRNWDLTKVIEGYLDDIEFKEFYEYLRTKIKYTVSSIRREYTPEELLNARLLTLWVSGTFEPTGEEVGTKYEYPCSVCKAGRVVKGNLILDLRKVPKGKDIANTIAEDERIISQHLAELIVDAKLTGFELKPVQHKARYEDDAVDLTKYPSGQKLLEKAKMAGAPYPTWSFNIWLNRPEQKELLHCVDQEYIQDMKKKESRKPRKPMPVWYQLVIKSTVTISEQTRYGDPFKPNLNAEQIKSSCGHVIGHTIFSEVYIKESSWNGADIVKTNFYFGGHINLIYPWPCILISQRFYRLLKEHNIKGYGLQVAHLVK